MGPQECSPQTYLFYFYTGGNNGTAYKHIGKESVGIDIVGDTA